MRSFAELTIGDHASGKVLVLWADEALAVADPLRALAAADLTAEDFVFA